MKHILILFLNLLLLSLWALQAQNDKKLEDAFKNPPRQFKPMPFWHINDSMTTEGIHRQIHSQFYRQTRPAYPIKSITPTADPKAN